MSAPPKGTVSPAPLCDDCMLKLVRLAHYRKSDPWIALSVAAQIALFQATTADQKAQKQMGGDVKRIYELGCLGCRNPDKLEAIGEIAKTKDLGAVKRLGEKWVLEAAKPRLEH